MVQVHIAKRSQGKAENQLWAVPEKYDSEECDQPGSVTKLTYRTKAYGTDMRDVEKSAYVYLPYGYDETKQYNILYLMHGTGDNEAYWFETHAYNKTMVDHLIASGDIDPLIIVTPTFYVEDDCMNELDHLTYSFAQELRNDLMPVVESTYSTYAESCDSEGFIRSRDHRAFAGLSRGAVTAYHSAMCASLDYFSWFGAFSGSRTTADYFRDTIQSEGFEDYSINYLYVSSGNFDFALPNQLEEYQALLDLEPRLVPGENTALEVYPMRYHSIGSWHLALYNFLLKIF
jgi:enterochelin esterase-like enzyme